MYYSNLYGLFYQTSVCGMTGIEDISIMKHLLSLMTACICV